MNTSMGRSSFMVGFGLASYRIITSLAVSLCGTVPESTGVAPSLSHF